MNIRKRQRLKEYNYSTNWYYFLTLCTYNRDCLFGDIANEKMNLNCLGRDIDNVIKNITKFILHARIDAYIIMPNHLHLIISIENDNKNGMLSVSQFVQRFKMFTRKIFNDKYFRGTMWQKSFYDRVIRNEKEYLKIVEYILNNPLKWYFDKYNKEGTTRRSFPTTKQ